MRSTIYTLLWSIWCTTALQYTEQSNLNHALFLHSACHSNTMGNYYSKEAYVFTAETIVSSAAYWMLFWKLFSKFESIGKSPKDCLLISTNTNTFDPYLNLSAWFRHQSKIWITINWWTKSTRTYMVSCHRLCWCRFNRTFIMLYKIW